MVDKQISVIME